MSFFYAVLSRSPYRMQKQQKSTPRRAFFSIFPDHGLYQADDLRLAAIDGLVIVIFRHEPYLAVPALQALDRGFIADPRHHDLPVQCRLLGADHHLIAA